MPWGDAGVSEQLLIQEQALYMPGQTGGVATRTLQRAGLLERLRFWAWGHLNVTAYTAAPTRSIYGPLGSYISNLRIEANGQIPLVNISGLGMTIYNEAINQDGSVLATPAYVTGPQVAAGASLWAFDAVGATGDFYIKYPFEVRFAIPTLIQNQMFELGLWLLQAQAIDVSVTATFNPLYQSAASYNVPWTAGTGITATATLADCYLAIERALYSMPSDVKDLPPLTWAHQIIEFQVPFTSKAMRFSIPRAGLLLRAVIINLDSNGAPVEYTDVADCSFIYGSNETPVKRPGWAFVHEYLMDYNRYPPKGSFLFDFYKWGWNGLKFVKSTEDLANLRIEQNFTSTSAGTSLVILDRLIPVQSR